MNIVRFQPEHLRELVLQEDQTYLRPLLERPEYGPALALSGPAFSAFHGDILLGCGGAVEFGKHRAEIWALLSRQIGPHMRAVSRAINGWLDICPYRRVEANVAPDFPASMRWIRLLGFEQEGGDMRKFFADGRSAVRFVRLKE